jgi:uncharacterized repeat protein (TIGR02543 family)
MNTKSLNNYKGVFDGGGTQFCVAETITEAAELFTEDQGQEPVLLQRTGTGVKVIVPDPELAFVTKVGDTEYTAGCRAYPSKGDVVRGQKLFLSAVTADGYTFKGWYQDGVTEPLSTDEECEVTVSSDSKVPVTITYEARFELN